VRRCLYLDVVIIPLSKLFLHMPDYCSRWAYPQKSASAFITNLKSDYTFRWVAQASKSTANIYEMGGMMIDDAAAFVEVGKDKEDEVPVTIR
jgi:hypothetical protein